MGHVAAGILFFITFLSPPFLGFFAWKNFLRPLDISQQERWKIYLDWFAILCASSFFLVCFIAAFVIAAGHIYLSQRTTGPLL